MQEFIRRLENDTIFLSDHISVPFHVRARIPERKEQLISEIQNLIERLPEESLRMYREQNPIM